jgi:integrase
LDNPQILGPPGHRTTFPFSLEANRGASSNHDPEQQSQEYLGHAHIPTRERRWVMLCFSASPDCACYVEYDG